MHSMDGWTDVDMDMDVRMYLCKERGRDGGREGIFPASCIKEYSPRPLPCREREFQNTAALFWPSWFWPDSFRESFMYSFIYCTLDQTARNFRALRRQRP